MQKAAGANPVHPSAVFGAAEAIGPFYSGDETVCGGVWNLASQFLVSLDIAGNISN